MGDTDVSAGDKVEAEYFTWATSDGLVFSGAYVGGGRGEWWVLMMPEDKNSHSWPVSFNTKKQAMSYIKEQSCLRFT